MYPARLSLLLLPWTEALQLATLADCARRLVTIFGAPWHIRFRLQLAMLASLLIRVVGAVGVAVFTLVWIREQE